MNKLKGRINQVDLYFYKFNLKLMMKLIFTSICLISISFFSQAQSISEHALGMRFGGNNGYGAEIFYQRVLGSFNRLEVDLGRSNDRHFNAYKLTGLYQWLWKLEGNFNWSAGLVGE